MIPYPTPIEASMRTFCGPLREKDRRRYAAVEAHKLGHGGIAYVARLLDIDPKTIQQGLQELQQLPDVPPERCRKLDALPQLRETFRDVLHDHTAGSPTEEAVLWTDLTAREIADRLGEQGFEVSVHIVDQLLDYHDYHRRQAFKSLPMGQFPQRNEQFEYIAEVRRPAWATLNPVLSIDTKKRELIGPFDRGGWLYTQQRLRGYDHDFPRFAKGVVIPQGILDLKLNRAYVHLGTSSETSAFVCDCLEHWWYAYGAPLYPQAEEVLLFCDGGGGNSARTYLFKADLQQLANQLGKPFRVLHYPPYCSKWNPIEHRLFPHLSRVCRGVVFQSVALVQELMAKAKTRTGLSVVVDILDKAYPTGRKVAKAVKQSLNLVRDQFLPQLNYRVLPAG